MVKQGSKYFISSKYAYHGAEAYAKKAPPHKTH
jgi:hypothetical protein